MKSSKHMDDLFSVLTENMDDRKLYLVILQSDLSSAAALRRADLGLSQSDVAKKIGKTQSVVSKWENGDQNFTLSTLVDIAFALDMDLEVNLSPHKNPEERKIEEDQTKKIIDFSNWKVAYSSSAHYTSISESEDLEEM